MLIPDINLIARDRTTTRIRTEAAFTRGIEIVEAVFMFLTKHINHMFVWERIENRSSKNPKINPSLDVARTKKLLFF